MPVRVHARRLSAPPLAPEDVVRRCRGIDQPVVLAGSWAAGEVVVAAEPLVVETRAADFLRALDQQPPVEGPVEGPANSGAFGGGWFGWLGFEALSGDTQACAFGFYPNVLRLAGGVWWDEALVGLVPDPELEGRRRRLSALLERPPPEALTYRLGPITASRNRAEHTAAVERCIQHIRAGEIYQANICLTLRSDFRGSPADLGADLLSATQPPYGAYLALCEQQVASASPELFVRRNGRLVTSTPIKGTRPRTPATAEAERLRLAGSQKDRAENVMIVDLVRNDLSRVAETGSVRVSRLFDVVPAPGVWHLLSSIEARLPAGTSDGDLLRATFPPGSVSGAPKSRAVEIIAELEDGPRGVYTGAIGYASPVAGAEFSVGIRTAQIRGGRFALGVGGGITVDSTPLQEWWECFDKARPLLAAVGGEVIDPLSRRSARDPLAECGICDTSLLRHGVPQERAEHLARLERAYYELYQRPLPSDAADALLRTTSDPEPWLRQRIDVAADGAVTVVRGVVPAPVTLVERPGEEAVLIPAQTGFGAYKWSERRRQEELEAAHPGKIAMLAGPDGLLETTRANVFAVVGDRLVTPPLDGRVLPGVTRTVILELARDLGVEIELRVPGLREANALAVASSVAGMRWIERCGDVVWATPGDLLEELSRRLVTRWAGGVTVAR